MEEENGEDDDGNAQTTQESKEKVRKHLRFAWLHTTASHRNLSPGRRTKSFFVIHQVLLK